MNNHEACIVLNMISGVGHVRFHALIDAFKEPSIVLEQDALQLNGVKGISKKLAESVANWRNNIAIDKELAMAERSDVKIFSQYSDDGYPELFRQGVYDPPLCLYVRGKLPKEKSYSLGVVGSRRATNYARKMTRTITESAVFHGWNIISGLAFGVDAIAHQTTVDLDGITVAVLGGGLTKLHPQEHVGLARDIIAKGGAVISEFPLGFPVSRQSFPRRNRIISALSHAVLVTEAAEKSGALSTASSALQQNRPLFVVPGQADNPNARGSNKLLKENAAKFTEQFEDIAEEFEYVNIFDNKNDVVANLESSLLENSEEIYNDSGKTEHEDEKMVALYSDEEQTVINALKLEDKSFDVLVKELQLEEDNEATGKLLGILIRLELRAVIVKYSGAIYSLNKRMQ